MTDQRRGLRRLFNHRRETTIFKFTKRRNRNEKELLSTLDGSSSTCRSSTSSLEPSLDLKSSLKSLSSSTSSSSKKTVRFGSIRIREHELTMDVNPAVSCGPAISLSWNYQDLPTISDIQAFEEHRLPNRRDKFEFQMSRHHREFLLREEFGFTRSDIIHSMKDIRISQRQRNQSICDRQKAVELTEWFQRRLLKLTGQRRPYEEDEALLWHQAHLWRQAMDDNDKQKLGENNIPSLEEEKNGESSCCLSSPKSMEMIDTNTLNKHVFSATANPVARRTTSNAAA